MKTSRNQSQYLSRWNCNLGKNTVDSILLRISVTLGWAQFHKSPYLKNDGTSQHILGYPRQPCQVFAPNFSTDDFCETRPTLVYISWVQMSVLYFMNSQEAGIAYLKWGQALPALVYKSRALSSQLSVVRKEKSCHPVTSQGTLRNVWRGSHRRVSLGMERRRGNPELSH